MKGPESFPTTVASTGVATALSKGERKSVGEEDTLGDAPSWGSAGRSEEMSHVVASTAMSEMKRMREKNIFVVSNRVKYKLYRRRLQGNCCSYGENVMKTVDFLKLREIVKLLIKTFVKNKLLGFM